MGKTFVMGDIHGAYRALRQCLQLSSFNYDADRLIFLGDVSDGWPDTNLCIDELLKIKNLVYVFGNHDYWTLEWMTTGEIPSLWYRQGGESTINSYPGAVPESHIDLLKNAKPYFIDKNRIFVHAGINPDLPLDLQDNETFLWDRALAVKAISYYDKPDAPLLSTFDEIYIGHTPIQFHHPIKCCEVWFMDTGAGWSGVLSMMDVDSKELFTSDPVPLLYPGVKGRTKAKH